MSRSPTMKPTREGLKGERFTCLNHTTGMREWCVGCYANLRGRGNFKGHRYYRVVPTIRPIWEGVLVKRPEATEGSMRPGTPVSDAALGGRYPTVVAYLSDDKWDDGKAREVSVLSIGIQDGGVNLALNDKALKCSLYTRAETLKEALKLMEEALVAGTASWRFWKGGRKG